MRKDEIDSLYPSIKKIEKKLNWRPKTNLNNGIKTIRTYVKKKDNHIVSIIMNLIITVKKNFKREYSLKQT